jgi:hypothetical protein
MPQTITLEIADDGAVSVSVEMDGGAPQMMSFDAVGDALEAIEELVGAENAEPKAMWDEEAASRSKNNREMYADQEMM